MNDIVLSKIIDDPTLRRRLALESHYWFFHIYFSHYVKYSTAPFHKEIFQISEDKAIKQFVLSAFRGSGKSTIMTLSYPIWSILSGKAKFIVLISQTQEQVRLMLSNIKTELESNELLINDFGPFNSVDAEWRSNSLVLPQFKSRLMAKSYGESIRGIRHREKRPDLIILDDVEDLDLVKTQESRNNIYRWFKGDIFPAGDLNTKIVVIGSLLHEDALIPRLVDEVKTSQFSDRVYKYYPIIDSESVPLWPGKFSTLDDVDLLREGVSNDQAWAREYLLQILAETDQVVNPEWIHYYDELPDINNSKFIFSAVGVDLAISQSTSADYTSMVSVYVFRTNKGIRIYVLPNSINIRMTFPETVDTIKSLYKTISPGKTPKIYVEDVAYQKAIIQQLNSEGYRVYSVKVSANKRIRLSMTTYPLRDALILFPRKGSENLIRQLIGFGREKHDDLADAFSIVINEVMKRNHSAPNIGFI